MIADTSHKPTEPNDRSMYYSSQSYPLEDDRKASRPSRKQLDLDGIRELILEMRI